MNGDRGASGDRRLETRDLRLETGGGETTEGAEVAEGGAGCWKLDAGIQKLETSFPKPAFTKASAFARPTADKTADKTVWRAGNGARQTNV